MRFTISIKEIKQWENRHSSWAFVICYLLTFHKLFGRIRKWYIYFVECFLWSVLVMICCVMLYSLAMRKWHHIMLTQYITEGFVGHNKKKSPDERAHTTFWPYDIATEVTLIMFTKATRGIIYVWYIEFIPRDNQTHDDVIKWKHFPRYWPFVRGIHRSPVNSPHKDQWRGALMFFFDLRLNKRMSK